MTTQLDQMIDGQQLKNEYLNQRKGINKTEVNLEITGDISHLIYILSEVLEKGDFDNNQGYFNFFDQDDDDKENENQEIQIDENLTGKTLTHLTLRIENSNLNNNDFIAITEIIDLCPNLEYLQLCQLFVELSKKLISLSKLKVLNLQLSHTNFNNDSFKDFAKNLSQITSLYELNINLKYTNPAYWKIFYDEIGNLKKLNKLGVKTAFNCEPDQINLFSFKFYYKNIIRLVTNKDFFSYEFNLFNGQYFHSQLEDEEEEEEQDSEYLFD